MINKSEKKIIFSLLCKIKKSKNLCTVEQLVNLMIHDKNIAHLMKDSFINVKKGESFIKSIETLNNVIYNNRENNVEIYLKEIFDEFFKLKHDRKNKTFIKENHNISNTKDKLHKIYSITFFKKKNIIEKNNNGIKFKRNISSDRQSALSFPYNL